MNQMGIKNLINRNAPAGEQVAFINEREADLLRRSGGSGRTDNNPYGIPSYDMADDEQTSPQSDDGGSAMDGDSGDSINSASGMYSAPATGDPVDLTTPLTTRAPAPNKSNELGFFGTIGDFLSKTISHIAKNPGTFLMNTAINLTPVGALANIASGLTTGSSIGTNISNTVGTKLGLDPVAPSAFNEALGDVGKGVLSGIPAGLDLSSFLSANPTPTQTPTTVPARSVATPSINDPFGGGNNIYDTEIVPKGIY